MVITLPWLASATASVRNTTTAALTTTNFVQVLFSNNKNNNNNKNVSASNTTTPSPSVTLKLGPVTNLAELGCDQQYRFLHNKIDIVINFI